MASQEEKEKNSEGRPSKYKEVYCQEIIDFFDIEPYRTEEITITYKNGDTRTDEKEVANNLLFISGFAKKIGVSHSTINLWAKKHSEFSLALKEAKRLQKEHLITNGLRNNFAQPFAIFTMKNICGWRDKTDTEHSFDDGTRRLLQAALTKKDKANK